MNEDIPFATLIPTASLHRPWYHWRRLGFNFLTISVLAHLFFGLGATYLVVQTIQAKRRQTFAGASQAPSAPTRMIEHKVQMQKKQQTMSAPAPMKRIATTSITPIALPAMPAMPRMDSAITPMAMAGMGGTGVNLGMGLGGGKGSGGSGGGPSLFGLRENRGGALVGSFFDFKQTPDRRPTPIAPNGPDGNLTPAASNVYKAAVAAFVIGGMEDLSIAGRYFKGPNPLYATHILIPSMPADEGPKAFNLQGSVQPSRWIVHYRGMVVAPESGTFRFVGVADDILVVRFNNNIVLDCGFMTPTGRPPNRFYTLEGTEPLLSYLHGVGEGSPVNVTAGQSYPIDIVIGEWPGGKFLAYLLIKKEGADYKKDSHGNPILPLFRVTDVQVPPAQGIAPVFDPAGPIWKTVAAPP